MRNAAALALLLFAAGAAGACHGLLRPAAPPYTITGQVEKVDSGSMSLRHKSGQRLTVALVSDTAVTNDGRPAAAADIAAGMRVVVVYHFADAAAVADEVRLFHGPINYP
jgi:hypothetical protein